MVALIHEVWQQRCMLFLGTRNIIERYPPVRAMAVFAFTSHLLLSPVRPGSDVLYMTSTMAWYLSLSLHLTFNKRESLT